MSKDCCSDVTFRSSSHQFYQLLTIQRHLFGKFIPLFFSSPRENRGKIKFFF